MRWERAVAGWSLTVVSCTLVEAAVRLGARGLATLRSGTMEPGHWAAWVVIVALFAYGEGYRALHRRFVPAVVAGARRAAARPLGARWLAAILAPLQATSLVDRDVRRCGRAWAAVVAIVAAVMVVRELPDPWRGIVDSAVAVALGWGACALAHRVFAGGGLPVRGVPVVDQRLQVGAVGMIGSGLVGHGDGGAGA